MRCCATPSTRPPGWPSALGGAPPTDGQRRPHPPRCPAVCTGDPAWSSMSWGREQASHRAGPGWGALGQLPCPWPWLWVFMGGTWLPCPLSSLPVDHVVLSTPLLELEVLREGPGGARGEGWTFEVVLGRGGVDAPITCGQCRPLGPTQHLGGNEASPRPGALTPVLSPRPPLQPPTPDTHTPTCPTAATWARTELGVFPQGGRKWVHEARDPGRNQAMSAPGLPRPRS